MSLLITYTHTCDVCGQVARVENYWHVPNTNAPKPATRHLFGVIDRAPITACDACAQKLLAKVAPLMPSLAE